MAAILGRRHFQMYFFLMKMREVGSNFPKIVPRSLIDDMPALI